MESESELCFTTSKFCIVTNFLKNWFDDFTKRKDDDDDDFTSFFSVFCYNIDMSVSGLKRKDDDDFTSFFSVFCYNIDMSVSGLKRKDNDDDNALQRIHEFCIFFFQ